MSIKPTKINLFKIDELGSIRQKIAELAEREKELANEIKPLMEDGEVIETGMFRAELVIRNNRVIDQQLAKEKLGQKRFLALAKVSVTDLGKALGKEEIDEITSEFKPVRTLNVDPI